MKNAGATKPKFVALKLTRALLFAANFFNLLVFVARQVEHAL